MFSGRFPLQNARKCGGYSPAFTQHFLLEQGFILSDPVCDESSLRRITCCIHKPRYCASLCGFDTITALIAAVVGGGCSK